MKAKTRSADINRCNSLSGAIVNGHFITLGNHAFDSFNFQRVSSSDAKVIRIVDVWERGGNSDGFPQIAAILQCCLHSIRMEERKIRSKKRRTCKRARSRAKRDFGAEWRLGNNKICAQKKKRTNSIEIKIKNNKADENNKKTTWNEKEEICSHGEVWKNTFKKEKKQKYFRGAWKQYVQKRKNERIQLKYK